jgi:hypothetical protein
MNLQESPNSVTFASKIKVTEMEELLRQYAPITLDEMTGVKLLNRTDTKFVTNMSTLMQLLEMASDDYYVQDIDGARIASYYTVYFDTADCVMYRRHEAGHMNRQKLRIRSYVDSDLNFLEVKTKNNRGRTKKKRLTLEGFDPEHCSEFRVQSAEYADFLHTWLRYDPALMTEQLENRFDRITLVNKGKTERLTIDTNLRFHNIVTDSYRFMDGAVIIELKRDGNVPSPILRMLRDLRIKPHGFSKYCIGSAFTNEALHRNRIKPKMHDIEKIIG